MESEKEEKKKEKKENEYTSGFMIKIIFLLLKILSTSDKAGLN